MKIDAVDKKIISILQKEGRIRTIDLAEQIGLSPTPCARRIVRLEEEGVITGYTATVKPRQTRSANFNFRVRRIGQSGCRSARTV